MRNFADRKAGLLRRTAIVALIALGAGVLIYPAKSEAHIVTKQACVKYAIGKPGGPDIVQYHACWKWAKRHNAEHTMPVVLNAIRACESGARSHGRAVLGTFNYQAQNPISTASGGYQYLDSTWANYHGYARAKYAPRAVQDERALSDYKRHGTGAWQFGDWRHCWGFYLH